MKTILEPMVKCLYYIEQVKYLWNLWLENKNKKHRKNHSGCHHLKVLYH